MADPLGNPRPIWKMHYDHRTLAGRWGRFLARTFGLKTSGQRYMESREKYVRLMQAKRENG